ncbi:MAG: aldo/keto reductase [Oscillospiraceae bacterium]|nr:aldo/keto reductase [Oscillospiraceae bacterium]
MKYIDIGESGLKAPVLGLGCMRISDMGAQELSALVNTCMELKINLFDHADIYGGGSCEEIFGEFLTGNPGIREKIIIQSKCGIRKGFFDLSKEYILESAEAILKRLKTDYMDVFFLHRPDTLMEPDEIAEAFDALLKSGKVRHFGVSNMNPAQITFLQEALGQKIIVNQLQFGAAHTGIIDTGIYANMTVPQSVDHDGNTLEFCRRKNITIQAWSPLQYGFFEGNFLGSEKHPELNASLNRIASEKSVTAGAVAIAWILRHPAKMQVILGSTKSARIEEMAKAADIELSREEWYEIYQAAGNNLP